MDEEFAVRLPPFPDGALGWNVYTGNRLMAFAPNEDELTPAAERLAEEAEAFAAAHDRPEWTPDES